MTEPSSSAVEAAIAARIAKVRAEGERRRQERAEFAAARAAGLGFRHAARLRNAARSPQDPADVTETVTTDPDRGETPTVADSSEETPVPTTPFRSVVCPSCRAQRTVRRVGTVTVSRTLYDVVRCPQAGCELLWCAPPERPRVAA
jgi:hypothetical protein